MEDISGGQPHRDGTSRRRPERTPGAKARTLLSGDQTSPAWTPDQIGISETSHNG
jgi:hypothetical protein